MKLTERLSVFRYRLIEKDKPSRLITGWLFHFCSLLHNQHANVSTYFCILCDGDYYRVPRGGVIQINPGEVHDGFAEEGAGYSYFMMYIPQSLFQEAMNAYTCREIRDFRFADTVISRPELRTRILNLVQNMKFNDRDPMLTEELFLKVAEAFVEEHTGIDQRHHHLAQQDPLILQAKDFIHDHLQQNISLDELSRAFNITKYHFVRLFKEQTGRTPYQYILDCKINAARKDLEQLQDTLDVAERYGFYDLSHFNRRFKEVYGATPLEFQKDISLHQGC